MFEFEIESDVLSAEELPASVRAQFSDGGAGVSALSLLRWEEHCTECAFPSCYTTCDLYEARNDGNCRRFLGGSSALTSVPTHTGYVTRIRFKRWAQLLGFGHLRTLPIAAVGGAERVLADVSRGAARAPRMGTRIGRPGLSGRLVRKLKQAVTGPRLPAGDKPDHFLAEIHNPQAHQVALSLTIGNTLDPAVPQERFPYQQLLHLEPGFSRIRIPYGDIAPHLDPKRELCVGLVPNVISEAQEGLTLYFGVLGFVADAHQAVSQHDAAGASEPDASTVAAKTVKVLAWDLDNTVWDGVLVEDGSDGLSLKPGVADIILELDRRGIMNTVVSKNDAALAMAQLERFGLAEYMVFPEISWEPKSLAIQKLCDRFNVGMDTIAFIDDSAFEREEVRASHAAVRIFEHDTYQSLLSRPEFSPTVTAEASRRRAFYLNQDVRNVARTSSGGDYATFLRDSSIELRIAPATEAELPRVNELVQRTNQMNFSATRYSRDDIAQLVRGDSHDNFLMDARDRFGDYGLIGFCLVQKEPLRVVDLMFSCRVQSKHIEHAFLCFLMQRYRTDHERLDVAYTRTDRNYPVARVFDDLRFRTDSQDGASQIFSFDLRAELPTEELIAVTWEHGP